jgi:hypothetical protein
MTRCATKPGLGWPLLAWAAAVAACALFPSRRVRAQEPSAATTADTVATSPDPGALPVFLTIGVAYGMRIDGCATCPSPVSSRSFSGHLGVGKYLVDKLAVGLEGSVWRRGQPGAPLGGDSLTVGTPVKLVGYVGNTSLVFSYQRWHVFARGGIGVAFARQDVQDDLGISRATGWGVGYTAGVGATLPLVSLVSVAFFANYNAGWYDLATPTAVLEQSAHHQYVETGIGLTLR